MNHGIAVYVIGADGCRNPRISGRSQAGGNDRCGARIRCEFYRRQSRCWRDRSGNGRLPQGSRRQGGPGQIGRLPANHLLWVEQSAGLSADRHIQGQAGQFDREAEERASERKDDMIESDFESLKRGLAQVADYRSEEHTSELQSLMRIAYAVFCLKTRTK